MATFYPNQLIRAEDLNQFSDEISSGILTDGIFNYNSNSTYSINDYLKDPETGNLYLCKEEIPQFAYLLPLLNPSYIGNYTSTGQTVVMVTSNPSNPIIKTGLLFLEENSVVNSLPDTNNIFSTSSILASAYDNFNNSGLWFSTSKGVFNLVYSNGNYILNSIPLTSTYNISQIQITSNGYVILAQAQGQVFYTKTTTPTVALTVLLSGNNTWVASCTDNTQFVYLSASNVGVYYVKYTAPGNLSLQLISGPTQVLYKSMAINLNNRVFLSSNSGQLYVINNQNGLPNSVATLNNSQPVNDTFIIHNQIVDFQGNVYFIGQYNIWSISPLAGFNIASINLQCPNTIVNGTTDGEGYPYFFGEGGFIFKIVNISQALPSVNSYFTPNPDVTLNSVGRSIEGNIFYCAQSPTLTTGYIFIMEQDSEVIFTVSNEPDYTNTSLFALALNGYEAFTYAATIGTPIATSEPLPILQTMSFVSANNITVTLFNPTIAPQYTIGMKYRIIATYSSGTSSLTPPNGVTISGQSTFQMNPYDSITFVHDGKNFYCI